MGLQRRLVVVAVALLAWYIAARLNHTPPLPEMNPNPWWGHGEPKEEKTTVRPFKIDVSKEVRVSIIFCTLDFYKRTRWELMCDVFGYLTQNLYTFCTSCVVHSWIC